MEGILLPPLAGGHNAEQMSRFDLLLIFDSDLKATAPFEPDNWTERMIPLLSVPVHSSHGSAEADRQQYATIPVQCALTLGGNHPVERDPLSFPSQFAPQIARTADKRVH